MSKRKAVSSDQTPETKACEYAEQEKVMALFSPELQKTIKEFKASLDGIFEASRRIGICGSKILREINLSLIR